MIQTSNPRMWQSEKSSVFVFIFLFCAMCYVLFAVGVYAVCSCSLISRFIIFGLVKYLKDVVPCDGSAKQWKTTIPVGLFPRDQSIFHSYCILYTYTIHNSYYVIFFFFLLFSAPVRMSVCLLVCLFAYRLFLFQISFLTAEHRTHPKWGYRK